MGNNMEVLFGEDDLAIEIMDRQLMDTVMDLRTAHLDHMTIEQSKQALEVLEP